MKIFTTRNIGHPHNLNSSSRAIEHGFDMRQSEVSIAMKSLIGRGWIKSRESSVESKGRPMKIYELAKPIAVIMNSIEKEQKTKADNQLALVRKLRDYIS